VARFSGGVAGVGRHGLGERTNRWGLLVSEGRERMHESKRKAYSGEYAKDARGLRGPTRGTMACE
jgi:hypothetical protein